MTNNCWASSTNSTTKPFLDILLKSLFPLIRSYVTGSINFIQHTPLTVAEVTILTSFEVTNLNINVHYTLAQEKSNTG